MADYKQENWDRATEIERAEAPLLRRIEVLDAKLFSLQTNHDDLAKWHEKHKDDAARVEELAAFIRSEGAAGQFIVWQAGGGRSMTGAEIDQVLAHHLARLREPMAVPKPPTDTEEEG